MTATMAAGNGQAPLESAHLSLIMIRVSGQEQDHGQFGQFRRLEMRQVRNDQSSDAPPPLRSRRAPPWPPSRYAAQKPRSAEGPKSPESTAPIFPPPVIHRRRDSPQPASPKPPQTNCDRRKSEPTAEPCNSMFMLEL